ncbi:retinol dehydrogenase 12-like isoform X2 [Ornithodoros turicata]|uniref:retinol dehydrogenase 12-like isoform X2 n=1 Tax=Ornithodoros turicata TaxID=34597 RepID=UPI003139E4F6
MLSLFVFVYLAWTVLLVGSAIWLFKRVAHKSCTSRKTMVGKTVIITGGNAGIGKETAIELASRGARVILACRSRSRGQEARDEIKRLTGGDVVLKSLDLCSLASVRAFAEDVLATESRLDVLINNAGIGSQAKIVTTVDGFEETFQANYLGHFLLTNLLLDMLKKSAPSRIIFVSSIMHYLGSNRRILSGYSDVKCGHVFGSFLYGDTKLAAIQFAKELSQRLKGTGVTANVLHPGYVQTNILFKGSNIVNMLLMCGSYIWAKTPSEGAQTTLHLALSDEVANVSGKYFSECSQAWTSFESFDREARKKIWEMSCRMTSLPTNLHEATSSSATPR